MKLIVKIMIALALLGGILLGIGLRSGGELYTSLQDGNLIAANDRFDSAAEHGSASVPDFESIDILRFEISGGSCEIEPGKGLSCSNAVDMAVEDNVVTFAVNGGEGEITLPEKTFETIRIDVLGGKLDADLLNASLCTININGGAAEIDRISGDNVRIHEQLGDIEVEQIDAGLDCQLVTRAGALDIEKLYTPKTEATCEGGNMELGLPYAPETYRCTADISAGACTWNGGALDKAGFGGADAENTLDLTVSAGAIGLRRAEKD